MQQRVVRFKLIVSKKTRWTQRLNLRLGQQDCRNNKVVKLLVVRAQKQIASRQLDLYFRRRRFYAGFTILRRLYIRHQLRAAKIFEFVISAS